MEEELERNSGRQSKRVSRINGLKLLTCDQLIQLNSQPMVTCLESKHRLRQRAQQKSLIVSSADFGSAVGEEGKRKKKRKKFSYSVFSKRSRKGGRGGARGGTTANESRRQYWAESIAEVKLNFEFDLLFLVKWEGYDVRDNTWQTMDDLEECDLLFQDFYAKEFRRRGEEVVEYTRNDLKLLRQCLAQTVDKEGDNCLVLRLSGVKVEQLDRSSDKQVKTLKASLEKYLEATRRVLRKKEKKDGSVGSDLLWTTKILIQYLVKELKILDNFVNLRAFFEFCDARKECIQKLFEWEMDINEQIRRNGSKEDKISVENYVDLEIPPPIHYLSDHVTHSDVTIESTRFHRVCCECADDCTRNRSCVCALKIYKDNRRFKSSNVLYECTDQCACRADTCPNRRVQKGRVGSDLVVFRTEGRGWGLMTRLRIDYKSFIMEYIGEVISSVQTRRRDPTYFFQIDAEFCGETLFVDGKQFGNVTRFANHCCEPNMDLHLAVIDNNHLVPRIAFFANRNIKAFEELTYDYKRRTLLKDRFGNYVNKDGLETASQDSGYTSNSSHDSSNARVVTSHNETDIKCLCGQKKCKGFI